MKLAGVASFRWQPQTAPRLDLLEQSWLHKGMLWFYIPAAWPLWRVGILAFLLLAALAGWWIVWLGASLAGRAAAFMLLLLAADTLWLAALPRLGVSWGEWQSHLFVLAAPRLLLAAAAALLARWWQVDGVLVLLAAGQLLGTVLLLWGTWVEPHRLSLTRLTIAVPGLVAPLRLLHVSDLHVERLSRRERWVLALARQANPDLILITGDYLNLSYVYDEAAQAASRQVLRQFAAPLGVYATLGSPPLDVREIMPAFFQDLPIHLLRHEACILSLENGQRLALLGIDCSHDLPYDGAILSELAAAVPDTIPRILLYHSPELMPQAAACGIDLYLCGHTHGGQVRLPLYGALITSSQLGKQYEMGHYQSGRTHLYVSRGIGLEGLSAPRVRFLCPPEITLVTLQPLIQDGGS
ncbi:MAG: hypothetical protein Fur0021_01240 [Candidatus Promineifilaceae bacterium]